MDKLLYGWVAQVCENKLEIVRKLVVIIWVPFEPQIYQGLRNMTDGMINCGHNGTVIFDSISNKMSIAPLPGRSANTFWEIDSSRYSLWFAALDTISIQRETL